MSFRRLINPMTRPNKNCANNDATDDATSDPSNEEIGSKQKMFVRASGCVPLFHSFTHIDPKKVSLF